MGILKEAYNALENVVGSSFISNDPVICEAYTPGRMGYYQGTNYEKFHRAPDCVVLPSCTKEVQDIIKIANRYKIPFVPASSFWVVQCAARYPGTIIVDLKRMDEFEMDSKHMFATVGPGLIYSPLQEEAFKCGLYTTVPGGGSQAAVIANHIHWGHSPLNFRNGWATRRILGVEWVFPNGELVRLGSLVIQDDPFWGEGIGPDLHGILRGWSGWYGSLGIVTKLAVKLLPFQPEKLKPTGISPHTFLDLPENRVKWYNIQFPDEDTMVQAMYELGKAMISSGVTRVPIMWRYIARSKSREEFWNFWDQPDKAEEVKKVHILRVLIIGFTNEEQLQYEERVLNDITEELGGQMRRTRQMDASWFKNADSATMWAMTGSFLSVEGMVDTVACARKTRAAFTELKKKYTPPLMEDHGDMGWYQVNEVGHNGYMEFLTYHDPDDKDMEKVEEWAFVATPKMDIEKGTYNAFVVHQGPIELTGPPFGPNHHIWMFKLKDAFDPNNISNPPVPHHIDDYLERTDLKELQDWEQTGRFREIYTKYKR